MGVFVPFAAGGFATDTAINFLIVLASAALVAIVLGRLRISPVSGYLIAGVILGSFIVHDESVDAVNAMAVVLLMFGVGLHMDLHTLRHGARQLILAGVLAVFLASLALLPLGPILGLDLRGTIGVALALSLSSTAVVLRLLQARREMRSTTGRIALGVLIVQDLAVIAMLAVVPLLAPAPEGAEVSAGGGLGEMLAKALVVVGGMGLLIFAGSAIVPRLIQAASRVSTEVMLVTSVAIVLLSALITSSLSLSAELGAFLAGLALASTPFRYQLSGQLAPIRDLFLAVFFTSIGMTVDLGSVQERWWLVPLGAFVLILLKSASIALAVWFGGLTASVAIAAGVMLAQSGEFSLVMVSLLSDQGVVVEPARSIVIATVVASLIVTPMLVAWAHPIGSLLGLRIGPPPWARDVERAPEGTDDDPRPLILVIGFGPIGRAVVDRLPADRFRHRIIELNADTVQRLRARGIDARFGDGSNPELLESVGADEAEAIIVTIPDDEAMLRICRLVRTMNDDACVVVRAGTLGRGNLARTLGATHAVVEEVAVAREMSEWVFHELGDADASVPDEPEAG